MDIQTQLQRCTSYAELPVVPTTRTKRRRSSRRRRSNTMTSRKTSSTYMEEQKVNFDTYFDPQLNLLTLNFHDREWEHDLSELWPGPG